MTMVMVLFQVQQEIARPGVLNKFLSDSEAKLVSQLFTGLYTLDMVSLQYVAIMNVETCVSIQKLMYDHYTTHQVLNTILKISSWL